MDPQLQKALSEFVNTVTNSLNTAADFSSTQISDVLQQLLLWHFIASAIPFTIGLIFFLAAVYGLLYAKKSKAKAENARDKGELWIYDTPPDSEKNRSGSFNFRFIYMTTPIRWVVCVLFIPAFIFMGFSYNWIKIWVAPKYYLLEYAIDLGQKIKGG